MNNEFTQWKHISLAGTFNTIALRVEIISCVNARQFVR
jgi:hypothetical protein